MLDAKLQVLNQTIRLYYFSQGRVTLHLILELMDIQHVLEKYFIVVEIMM